MKLQKGDTLMIRTKGLNGWLIRKATGSHYTHCGVYYGDNKIIEAQFGGVQLSSLDKYQGLTIHSFRHQDADPEMMEQVVTWMGTQLGKGYDYMGVLGIGLHMLGMNRNNMMDDKSKYWCSEFIADAYLKFGLSLDVDPKTWLVSPGQLAKDRNMIRMYTVQRRS